MPKPKPKDPLKYARSGDGWSCEYLGDTKPAKGWLDRLEALAKFLRELAPGAKPAYVIAGTSETIGGLRIVELGYADSSGGSAWLPGEESLAVFYAAEKFLDTHGEVPHRPEGWSSYINDHGNARLHVMKAMGLPKRRRDAEYKRQVAAETASA